MWEPVFPSKSSNYTAAGSYAANLSELHFPWKMVMTDDFPDHLLILEYSTREAGWRPLGCSSVNQSWVHVQPCCAQTQWFGPVSFSVMSFPPGRVAVGVRPGWNHLASSPFLCTHLCCVVGLLGFLVPAGSTTCPLLLRFWRESAPGCCRSMI